MINEKRLYEIISQFRKFYNSPGNISPKEFVVSFIGKEEYPVVKLAYDIIQEKNRKPSTHLWSISGFLEQEILEKILSNTLLHKA